MKTNLDAFLEGIAGIVEMDRIQRSDVAEIARVLFENADLEIAKTPKEYGLPLIRELYAKFRDEFFGGDDGYLPPEMTFEFHTRKTALGTCVTKVQKTMWFGFFTDVPHLKMLECKIQLSNAYDMPRKTFEEVLIHEMVHAYLTYEGVAKNSIDLVKCNHGTPFTDKCAEINARSNYRITVRNDDALTLSGGMTNRVMNDNTLLVVVHGVEPGTDGVSRVARKDLSWFVPELTEWLKREPLLYECNDANFKNRFPVKRGKVGYSRIPSSTISAMLDSGILKLADVGEAELCSAFGGCMVAWRPSKKYPGNIEYSVIDSRHAETLLADSDSYVERLKDLGDSDVVKFNRAIAGDTFDAWIGKPCSTKVKVMHVPEAEFRQMIADGKVITDA